MAKRFIATATTTEKVKGKNIRVPAEMKYGDYKAVYVDEAKIQQEKRAKPKNNQQVSTYSYFNPRFTQRQAEPLQIIDHKDRTGKVDKRAFYDEGAN